MKSASHYRPDIDGLRGIAVLFVLAFHGFARLLPGGFIGVDIFFVISGYLISSIIFRDLQRDRFTIHGFYARRIKRIFPALLTVLGATCALGWLLLFPDEFGNLGKHVAGGAAFISNILLWRETGYFNDAAELKPLLHLWSLGIEEQFYMFFPLLLWFAYRRGFATSRFLLVLLAISFASSAYGTGVRPIASFFLPVTRLWELLVGCTLAAHERERTATTEPAPAGSPWSSIPARCMRIPGIANVAFLAGLAMIFGGAAFVTKTDPFPGWRALFPTLGTALVVATAPASPICRPLLGNKLLVGFGLISYPLYLWHWPLLFFGRILSPDGMSNPRICQILGASVLLAWLTYLVVERPIRFGGFLGTRKVLFLSACMSGLLGFGILSMREAVPSRLGLNPMSREVGNAAAEWFYPFKDNFGSMDEFRRDAEISEGRTGSAVLFAGDSHMQHYWPKIDSTTRQLGNRARPVVLITAGGCPMLPNVNRVEAGYACDRFFSYTMQEASSPNIGTVVLSCFWEHYFLGRFPDGGPALIYRTDGPGRTPLRLGTPEATRTWNEFGAVVAKLSAAGKDVVVLLPTPTCIAWSPKRVSRITDSRQFGAQVSISRAAFEQFIWPVKDPLRRTILNYGGQVVDPLDYFEEKGYFNGKTPDGRFRYRDADHFRAFYVDECATFLDSMLLSHSSHE